MIQTKAKIQKNKHWKLSGRSMARKTEMAVRRRHQQQAVNIAGAAIGVLIAARLLLRLLKGSRGSSSEFKFILNLTSTQILKLAEDLIARSQKVHDLVAAVPLDKVSYENVIMPLAKLEAVEFALMQSCKFPRIVSTSKEVREASCDAEKALDAYKVKCSMRVDVYKVVKALSEKKKGLQPEAQRYVERLVRDYERRGLSLSSKSRDEVERLKTRIGELCIVFQNNVNEDDSHLYFSLQELAGMHPDFIKGLEVGEGGMFKVTLKSHHYFAIMEQCKVRSTRRAVAAARYRRCMKENVPILEKVLELRRKLAHLLGYKNWAEYALEICMAKSPEKVQEFHDHMLQHITPAAKRELKLLEDLKEEEEGDRTIGLEDVLYYIQKSERNLVDSDINEVKQYLPVEIVTTGLLRIYENLLGLEFQEIQTTYAWHEEVRQFSVAESRTKEVLGYFYLDLYPRDGKYSHSCVIPLQPGCDLGNGKRQLPVAALLINLTSTTSEIPALLGHLEVVTYFHEFGHVMHHICSYTSFARFSGLQVETDFLEAPSQMLENWCYEKESLELMSGLYKDPKKPIPDDLCYILMKKGRSFPALTTLRNQLFLGIFDQMLHTGENVDTESILMKLYPEVVLGIPMLERTNLAASTLHLMSSADDAVCYGYLWSKVFAADMFETKFKGKILNGVSGMEYRKKVLAPGATKDAIQILRDFLGRDPSVDAYLRLNGFDAA